MQHPRQIMRRLRFSAYITLASVLLSLASYWGLTMLLGAPFVLYGWIISGVVPVLVAPPVSWVASGLNSRLHSANLELARVQARFETQSARQRDVFRRLSHELRTPSAAIHMISGAPEAYAASREKVRDASGTLLHFLDAIQSAINARDDIGETRETFTLARLRDDLSFLGQAISSDGSAHFSVVTKWDQDLDKLLLEDDFLRLRACVMNLVRNALLHARAKSVTVEIGAVPEGDGVRAAFGVRDDGVGIPDAKIQEILRPYQRGDSQAEGSGLGLAIVQDWLLSFDSRLEVSSNLGEGSWFGFIVDLLPPVPAQEADADAAALNRAAGADDEDEIDAGQKLTALGLSVLLVEDHDITREIGQSILGAHFRQVMTAGSADAALVSLQSDPPDLLITDYMMPGMTGAQLVLRAYEQGFSGQAIGLTATRDPQVDAEFHEAGCSAILVKPLNPAKILSALEQPAQRAAS